MLVKHARKTRNVILVLGDMVVAEPNAESRSHGSWQKADLAALRLGAMTGSYWVRKHLVTLVWRQPDLSDSFFGLCGRMETRNIQHGIIYLIIHLVSRNPHIPADFLAWVGWRLQLLQSNLRVRYDWSVEPR